MDGPPTPGGLLAIKHDTRFSLSAAEGATAADQDRVMGRPNIRPRGLARYFAGELIAEAIIKVITTDHIFTARREE